MYCIVYIYRRCWQAGAAPALKEAIMHPGADPLPGPPASTKPPASVTVTRVMLAANAVTLLLLAAGVYFLAEAESPPSEALGRALVPALPAILNLLLAVQFGRGGQRMRWAVVILEAFTLLLGLAELGQGGLAGLLVALFSIVALISVNRPDVRSWLQRP
jgi:hypothetical protein